MESTKVVSLRLGRIFYESILLECVPHSLRGDSGRTNHLLRRNQPLFNLYFENSLKFLI